MTLHKPLWMQNLTYSAAEDRQLVGAIGDNGVLGTGELAVVQRAAGANMSVDIAPGRAFINGINGMYLCRSDSTFNRTISAAPSSGNTRIDVVYAQVRDAQATGSGTDNDWIFGVQQGTAVSSNPSAPAIPSYSIALARILLTGGQASITNAAITNARVQSASPADKYWPYVDAIELTTQTVGTTAATWGSITIPAPNRPVKVIAHLTGAMAAAPGETNSVNDLAIRLTYPGTAYTPIGNRAYCPHEFAPLAMSQVMRYVATPAVGDPIVVSARIVSSNSAVYDRGMMVVTVFPA